MANTEFNVRIQLKRDTDANWRAKDPKLLTGEMVFVDTNAGEVRTKVGDGTKKYSALPFTDEVLRNLVSDSSKPAFYFEGSIGENFSFTPTTTVADLNAAYEADRPCYCSFLINDGGVTATVILPLKAFNKDTAYLFAGVVTPNVAPVCAQVWSNDGGNSWQFFISELAEKDYIPTSVSQLTNDAGYLTSDSANSTYVKKTGDELIKGIKTFESSIVCSMTPGNENHLVNKKYVDNKIPTALKNPYALTVKGAISATYDGSKAISITIPNPGISETQADSKYLQLSGGTVAGELTVYTGLTIINGDALSETTIRAGADGLPTLDLAITPVSEYALVQKHYVDTCIEAKANVVLKTWTSADVS